jgi:hypothetical protein
VASGPFPSSREPPLVRRSRPPPPRPTPPPPPRSLSCRDCSGTFFHTVADQAFFAEKGFEQLPVRCGPCRKAKKANMDGGAQGGRGGFGGARPDRGNACFNCSKEGHMSRDCTEPRKAGGAPGGGACFKCGEMGHKSFDCPQGGGGGGGGRGGRGGYGGGRGGGGGRGRY